jgi:hypothetical protein
MCFRGPAVLGSVLGPVLGLCQGRNTYHFSHNHYMTFLLHQTAMHHHVLPLRGLRMTLLLTMCFNVEYINMFLILRRIHS